MWKQREGLLTESDKIRMQELGIEIRKRKGIKLSGTSRESDRKGRLVKQYNQRKHKFND